MAQTKIKLVSDGVITVDNLHTNHGITTDHIGEGTNKFFTDARVQSYLASNNYIKTTDVASLETVTSLSLSANILSYVDEAGNTTNLDLSLYLDDTNLARLVSGTLDGATGIATFTRDDATTFTVDLSSLTPSETDPVFSASAASGITSTNISNWNTAYGWGNHASAGYAAASSLSSYLPLTGGTISGVINLNDSGYLKGSPTYGFRFNNSVDSINALIVDNSGNSTAYSSHRAPIFYDSNNTGYYLNPASTSLLYDLAIGDNSSSNQKIDIRYGNYDSGYGAIRFHQAGTNHQTIHSFSANWQNNSFTGSSAGAINIDGENGVTFGPWNNVAAWIDDAGTFQANQSSRAPIFYDSNNTGYFLDPSSESYILNLKIGSKIGFAPSGNHTDGFPYARISEAWGVNFNPPDARWAPNVTGASFLVGFSSGGTNHGTGNIKATGDITAYASDKRLKTNIKPITNALNKVVKLNGVYYDWDLELCNKWDFHPSEKTESGVLAQDVQEVFPEVVQQAPFDYAADQNGNLISKSGENYLTVKYEKLVPLLIEAIKEQQQQIEELKQLINK